ncbi:MAG: hypothetical protein PVH07_09995 [Chloroflexota bacterium]
MRTMRVSLVGTVILALLGAQGLAVAAQDDQRDRAYVTGSITWVSGTGTGTPSDIDEGVLDSGVRFTDQWEASDPRLSGTSTYTGNWAHYGVGQAGFSVLANTRVVENDKGRWVGTSTGFVGRDNNTDAVILRGEDAYEGLTAYVVIDLKVEPFEFVAGIFPGEMPPFPEPPAD